jgi:hypothetical protein
MPIETLATPLGLVLVLGFLTHYLRKAIFDIPFFSGRSLLDDAFVVFWALALSIVARVLMGSI